MKNQNDHKFDTLSLLAELTEAESKQFSVDEIMKEFGTGTSEKTSEPEKPEKQSSAAVRQTVQNPAQEQKKENDADNQIISQIQQAIDHEMEMSSAEPDPVITIDTGIMSDTVVSVSKEREKKAAEKEEPLSEADALLRSHGFRLITHENKLPENPAEPPSDDDKPLPGESSRSAAENDEQTDSDSDEPAPVQRTRNPGTAEEPEKLRVDIRDVEERARPAQKKPVKKLKVVHEKLPAKEELYTKSTRAVHLGRTLNTVMLIAAVAAFVLSLIAARNTEGETNSLDVSLTFSVILAVLMLIGLGCAWSAFSQGLKDLTALKPSLNSLLLISFFVTLLSVFICREKRYLPVAFAACMNCLAASWGETKFQCGIRRSIRPLMKNEPAAFGVSVIKNAYEDSSTVIHDKADEKEHIRGLLSRGWFRSAFSWYPAAALVAAVVLAIVMSARGELNFFWSLSVTLSMTVPFGAFIAYSFPFSLLAGYWMKKNSAISGWTGVRELYAADTVCICDKDLFPTQQLQFGGVKLFDSMSMGTAASYAAAAMEYAGSELTPIFADLRDSNRGYPMEVTQFRYYEGGGYGAEIRGDVILVGCRRFMNLMGVRMKSESDISNAVYMSVNNVLKAVFVINYDPSAKIRKSLMRITGRTNKIPLFATRDFMLTPVMIERYFKIPNERLEFPSVNDRVMLSVLPDGKPGIHCAVASDDSFDTISGMILDSFALHAQFYVCTALSIALNAAFALVILIMTLKGNAAGITPAMVNILSLVSAIPPVLFSARRIHNSK